MEQDGLTPAARQHLNDADRLKAERVETVKAQAKKLRKSIEARGTANDDSI